MSSSAAATATNVSGSFGPTAYSMLRISRVSANAPTGLTHRAAQLRREERQYASYPPISFPGTVSTAATTGARYGTVSPEWPRSAFRSNGNTVTANSVRSALPNFYGRAGTFRPFTRGRQIGRARRDNSTLVSLPVNLQNAASSRLQRPSVLWAK
jgi:hypothetical protein